MTAQHSNKPMTIHLKVWRQNGKIPTGGRFVEYTVPNVLPDMSFLEMFDILNETLVKKGEDAIAFEHDCREGICGACSMVINGSAHGPHGLTTTCQLHMRHFHDGETLTVEPFRAKAFPVLKDLVVDRSGLDRIIQAGGYVSVNTGNAPDGNAIPVPKEKADLAMDAAACIGCGACVAACRNGAAMLFTAAKVSQLALLPQGQAERDSRVLRMVHQMDEEDFGSCTNLGSCAGACPKGIKLDNIARMNREFISASLRSRPARADGGDG